MTSPSPCSDEGWSRGSGEALLVGSGWSSLLGDELGESQRSSAVLLGDISQDGVWLQHDGLDDVDGISSSGVSTGHLVVHLGDGTAEGSGSVLLVHVDDTGSSKIFKDDSVVLDAACFFLENFADRDDFTLALSNLVLSLHLIPELGPGKHDVLGENSDSIACWLWGSLTWKLSSHNPKLLDLKVKLDNAQTKKSTLATSVAYVSRALG